MFCPNCGTKNEDTASFCANCGTPLKGSSAGATGSANQNTGTSFSSSAPAGAPPKTWLVESILVTLFCCLPFGIAGIINASKVESKFASGDIEGSEKSSAEAGKWTKIGFFIGIGAWVLMVIYYIVVIAAVVGGGGF